MKKCTAFFFSIIGLILVFACYGCAGDQTFTARRYVPESEVQSIVIDVSDREVEVCASDSEEIVISYYESEKEYYDISVSEGGELSMRLSLDRDWTDYVGTKPAQEYRKIKVEIPDRLLSGLTVKTTNESIHVSPLSGVASVSLESNGGNVEFEKLSVGESLTVTAKNGNILGSIVGGWDDFSISCEIKKGESNLPENKTGGDKTLAASCNNGDIQIDFVEK